MRKRAVGGWLGGKQGVSGSGSREADQDLGLSSTSMNNLASNPLWSVSKPTGSMSRGHVGERERETSWQIIVIVLLILMWSRMNVAESNTHNYLLKLFVASLFMIGNVPHACPGLSTWEERQKSEFSCSAFIFYLLFNLSISLTSVLCARLLQRAILPNPASRTRRGGEKQKPPTSPTWEPAG